MATKDKNYFGDLAKTQEKANQHLRDLVQWEKEGQKVEKYELNLIRSKLSDLETVSIGSVSKTAEILSKNLGAEEAFTREISHDMSIMFSKDKDLQIAFKKSSSDDKTLLIEQLKENVLKSYKQNEQFFIENEEFIEGAMKKVEDDMVKISETGSKMLYPTISGMTRSLDEFRHTLSDKFPNAVGRLLSDTMVEHYKTGAKEIGQHFQQHMSTILAPLDAIMGPIIAVSKSLFTIGKTLFSGPSKHEKETAKVQREIRDTLRGQRRDTKKSWLEDKKMRLREYFANAKEKGKGFLHFLKKIIIPLLALGVGMLIGYYNEAKALIGHVLSPFKSLGESLGKIGVWFGKIFTKIKGVGTFATKISTWFGKITSSVSGVGGKIMSVLTKGPIGKLFMFAGKIFGKLFMPLKMIWNFFKDFGQIKELFAGGDIVGIIKHVAGSILEPILDLPEMFINGLSWLFGSEFRVDFGKEKIMGFIDTATTWVFDNITDPVVDFFTIDIPTFFEKIFGIFGKIRDGLSGVAGKIFSKVAAFFGLGEDEDTRKEKYEKGLVDGSLKTSMPYDEFGDDMGSSTPVQSKTMSPRPSLIDKEKARANVKRRQLEASKETNRNIEQTNNNIKESNKTNQQFIENQQNIQVVSGREDFPTDTDSYAMLLLNKG